MGSTARRAEALNEIYTRLLCALGPQHWWPADSAFEMMVGAILTQSTTWHNVARALERLRVSGMLSVEALATAPISRIQQRLRPSGYFRQKARRVRIFSRWLLTKYGGRPSRMFQTRLEVLREEFLSLWGIGPETADAMLLYAGNQPVFVVDAYARRLFQRHRIIVGHESYDAVQRMVMRVWPRRADIFNEFHALLVAVGKQYCHRRNPDCAHCPLGMLPRQLEGI
jgi:endonuclease-3 related protein